MPHIRPVTARLPRTLLATVVSIVAVIVIPLVTATVLAVLQDRYWSFWTSEEGIAVAVVVVALLAFGLFPALLLWFSKGWIRVDSSGMRWKIRGERGEIRWDRPFTIRRWGSVMTVTTWGEAGSGPPGETALPVVVYEVSQGSVGITLYRGAGLKEVEGLPFGELRGVMLVHRARRLTDALEAVRQWNDILVLTGPG